MKSKSFLAVFIFVVILGISLVGVYAEYGVANTVESAIIADGSFVIALMISSAIMIPDPLCKALFLRPGHFHSLRRSGLFFIIPIMDTIPYLINTPVITTSFKAEKTLPKDTVPVDVDAILFWKVLEPKKAAFEVADYISAISWASQTARFIVVTMGIGQKKLNKENDTAKNNGL